MKMQHFLMLKDEESRKRWGYLVRNFIQFPTNVMNRYKRKAVEEYKELKRAAKLGHSCFVIISREEKEDILEKGLIGDNVIEIKA